MRFGVLQGRVLNLLRFRFHRPPKARTSKKRVPQLVHQSKVDGGQAWAVKNLVLRFILKRFFHSIFVPLRFRLVIFELIGLPSVFNRRGHN